MAGGSTSSSYDRADNELNYLLENSENRDKFVPLKDIMVTDFPAFEIDDEVMESLLDELDEAVSPNEQENMHNVIDMNLLSEELFAENYSDISDTSENRTESRKILSDHILEINDMMKYLGKTVTKSEVLDEEVINFIRVAHEKISLAVTLVKERTENFHEINETSNECLIDCEKSIDVEDHNNILGCMTEEILYHPIKNVDDGVFWSGEFSKIIQSSHSYTDSAPVLQVTNPAIIGSINQAVNEYDELANIINGDCGPKINSSKRRHFSLEEKLVLNKFWKKCKYPSPKDYEELAKQINSSKGRVKNFFKNQRHRKKIRESKGKTIKEIFRGENFTEKKIEKKRKS
jgi:hypothetical protein